MVVSTVICPQRSQPHRGASHTSQVRNRIEWEEDEMLSASFKVCPEDFMHSLCLIYGPWEWRNALAHVSPSQNYQTGPHRLSKCVLLKSFLFKDVSYWVLAGNLELHFVVAAGQMWMSRKVQAKARKQWIFYYFLWAEQLQWQTGSLDFWAD